MVDSLPLNPRKIIGVHLNYPSRAAQRGRTPAFPGYFFKPASSVSASGAPIERPAGTELLAFEGEIAILIGTTLRHGDPSTAWSAVSGVTAANDFGVYDLRLSDKGSNVRSKGGDGFTPLGPTIIPAAEVDPAALRIRTWVNGELVQDDTTANLLFPFAVLVADLSQQLTLEPGDVILTGTPAGASVVRPGDVVEVEVDAPTAKGSPSSGRLVTRVVEGTTPIPEFSAPPKITDEQRADAWGSAESAGLAPAFQLTDELKAKINSVGTATLSAQLRKAGYNNVSIDGLHSTKPGQRMVGCARTLRFVPNREDLFEKFGGGYNAQKRAFDTLGVDDVLVIEARGERGTGTVGDILGMRAQVRGAAGIVTDGGVRDLDAMTALDIPTWHAGAHPAVLGRRHVPWDTDLTVACGGATVQPGDVLIGDSDGVLVIPPFLVERIVDGAIEQELEETFIAERIAAGDGVETLYPMNAEWKERFTAWRAIR
ncbi:MAG TPA: fumarylacetoacetate hydrolase family protein [Galbitalea sp.]|jgi:2-keto-4-pentenoate hydratase/2-oxohepta-3-ene-1,7-dioic acid hydratase in catechol pathway/regulator of RNase E activity RraA